MYCAPHYADVIEHAMTPTHRNVIPHHPGPARYSQPSPETLMRPYTYLPVGPPAITTRAFVVILVLVSLVTWVPWAVLLLDIPRLSWR